MTENNLVVPVNKLIEFIKETRRSRDDPVIRGMPVVFYTAYRPDQVETILDQVSARDLPDISFCHSVEGLLQRVFEVLPAARAAAIEVQSQKEATDIKPRDRGRGDQSRDQSET